MKKLRRTLMIVTAVATAALGFAGCEDPGAKARAEVQAELTDAANEFQTAVLSQAGAVGEEGRTELRSILNRLTSASSNPNAGAGQKSSAQLLSADIHRLLADAQLSVVDELRSQQRAQRLAVYSMISGAERLQSIAAAIESGTVEEQVASLTQQRAQEEDALRREQAAIAQVESPISELESKISSARQQVTDLRSQENQLRRQAAELGYSQGFQTYEQAIALRQQADDIETSTSYDELSREYEYMPTREMHEQRIEQIESAIESIDLAIEELRENGAAASALAGKTRQALDAQMARINTEVEALTGRLENELKPTIEGAAQDLSAAASKAQQSANATPVGGTSARLTAGAASSSLGQIHAAWAFEQQQHAALLERLASSNLPGTTNKYNSQISTAEQARAEAVDAAVAAFTEAASTYQRITGANATTSAAIQQDLEASIAALTGQPPPTSPDMSGPAPAGDTEGGAPSETPSASAGQRGADSPEAIVAAIQAMNSSVDEMGVVDYLIPFEHVNFKSPGERAFAQGLIDLTNAMRELVAAVESQFGVSGDAAVQPILDTMNAGDDPFTGAELVSVEGDTAQLTVTSQTSGPSDVTATSVNGRWYIGSADDFSGGILDEATEMMISEPSMAQSMAQMFGAMSGAVRSLANRVRGGEFATIEEAHAAMGEAMQQLSGSMQMPQG